MKKKTRDWMVVALTFMVGALAIYGAMVWYFPAPFFASLLAVPVLGPSLYFAFRLLRVAPARQGKSKLVTAFLYSGVVVMLPLIFWCAVAFGIPALIMTPFGPNETMTASVLSKDSGPRSCPNQIALAELSVPLRRELCVSAPMYNKISVGQQVSLEIRRNVFGTRVFRIDPS